MIDTLLARLVPPTIFLFAPIVLLAGLKRRWVFGLLVATIPFHGLKLFSLFSHPFTPAEIAILLLGLHQSIGWVTSSEIKIHDHRPFLLLFGIGFVCIFSVLYAVINPPNAEMYPYTRSFGRAALNLPLVPFRITTKTITQLLLRLFFIGVVFLLAINLTIRRIRFSMRAILVLAVVTGTVGLAYQISGLLGASDIFRAVFHSGLGFVGFVSPTKHLGPIPRMYSFAGEPGFTADFLLYALGLSISLLLCRESDIIEQPALTVVTIVLAILLGLSTGSTGYGGLLILVAILALAVMLFNDFGPKHLQKPDIGVVLTATTVGSLAFIYFFPQVQRILGLVGSKLQFQTGSGEIRIAYMRIAFDAFRARPLFGLSVGSFRTPSFLSTHLAETGLVGVTVLFLFVGTVFRGCVQTAVNHPQYRTLAIPLFVSGTTLFLTNLIAKSIGSLMFPWVWFSLAMPLALMNIVAGGEHGCESE